MGLSRTDGGQFALLGGRRCLALVNLAQDPHTVIKRSGTLIDYLIFLVLNIKRPKLASQKFIS